MGKNALVDSIDAAFPNQPVPFQVEHQLRELKVHPEEDEACSLFLEKCWKEIPDSTLLANCPSPFLIGNLAFQYYLPAFLLAAVRHDDLLMESMIETLKPPRKEQPLVHFKQQFSELTVQQRHTVAQFWEYARDAHYYDDDRSIKRINNAIDRYWAILDSCRLGGWGLGLTTCFSRSTCRANFLLWQIVMMCENMRGGWRELNRL